MLEYFEVSGYKKFENSISIDFTQVRDYKFNLKCISENMIKSSIIYGKNSTGKSSLGIAILDITHSINNPKDEYDDLYYVNWNKDEAKFKYRFNFDNDIVKYEYSKLNKKKLTKEKLIINEKLIMECDYIDKKSDLIGLKEIAPTLNLNEKIEGSILRFALNNMALNENHALHKFKNFISKMYWFRTIKNNRYIGEKHLNNDYNTFLMNAEYKFEFEELLNKIGVKAKLEFIKGADDIPILCFVNESKKLPFFKVASSGTESLYLYFYITKMLSNASFIYMDEFDASYHHELSEIVIELLKERSGQTVLTTHNTNLFSNKIMRPDCLFILNDNSLVQVCEATKRELREGHNLEKLYVSGEFNV